MSRADPWDVSLTDPELLAEVELTTRLIIAVNESDEAPCPGEIDRLLGIKRE